MNEDWVRIPAPVESESDRRTLCAILTSLGLTVRIVKVKLTARGSVKKYVEYRAGEITSGDGKNAGNL